MQQVAFFKEIEDQFENKLPFVVFSKPNEATVTSYLQSTDEIFTTKEFNESGFVFAPFDSADDTILIPTEHSKVLELKAIQIFENLENKTTNLHSVSDKAKHISLVKKGIEAIKNGEFSKVVLSRTEVVSVSNTNPLRLFKKLISTYPEAFVYCWYHPKVGLWLGATPETLLTIEGKRFATMSLAGTQVFNGSLEVNWNVKEKEEQQIVTDYIINELQPFVSSISVSNAETVQAGKLLHLQSKISGILKELNLKEVLAILHPTPAVCGYPKEKAKQFILENEGYNRSFYSGFLGELNKKEKVSRNSNRRNVENNAYASVKTKTNLYVNLRCMQLIDDKTLLYVGGGITKDSSSEKEWQETVNKTTTIKNCL